MKRFFLFYTSNQRHNWICWCVFMRIYFHLPNIKYCPNVTLYWKFSYSFMFWWAKGIYRFETHVLWMNPIFLFPCLCIVYRVGFFFARRHKTVNWKSTSGKAFCHSGFLCFPFLHYSCSFITLLLSLSSSFLVIVPNQEYIWNGNCPMASKKYIYIDSQVC